MDQLAPVIIIQHYQTVTSKKNIIRQRKVKYILEIQLIDNNMNEKEMPSFLQPESLHFGKKRHRRKIKISVIKRSSPYPCQSPHSKKFNFKESKWLKLITRRNWCINLKYFCPYLINEQYCIYVHIANQYIQQQQTSSGKQKLYEAKEIT